MRFAFSAESALVRDSVRALLERECPPAAGARGVDERRRARARAVARARRARGRRASSRPEEHGGLGLTELDLVLVLEECGRVRGARADRRDGGGRGPAARRRSGRAGTGAGSARSRRARRRSPSGSRRRPSWRARRGRRPAAAARRRAPRRRARRGQRSTPQRAVDGVAPPLPRDLAPRRRATRLGVRRRRASRSRSGHRSRGGRRRRASSSGSRAHMLDDDRRVREGAPPVRQAHRQLPGRQAPPGRRAGRHRDGGARRVPRRVLALALDAR